jgi:surface antigen
MTLGRCTAVVASKLMLGGIPWITLEPGRDFDREPQQQKFETKAGPSNLPLVPIEPGDD